MEFGWSRESRNRRGMEVGSNLDGNPTRESAVGIIHCVNAGGRLGESMKVCGPYACGMLAERTTWDRWLLILSFLKHRYRYMANVRNAHKHERVSCFALERLSLLARLQTRATYINFIDEYKKTCFWDSNGSQKLNFAIWAVFNYKWSQQTIIQITFYLKNRPL